MGGIKITPADSAFAKCVKERVNYTCERCGTRYQEGHRGLHCSHGLGRGQWGTRFVGLNAIAACYGCHQIEGGNWMQRMLSEEQRLLLREMADDTYRGKTCRKTKGKGEIAAHYREQFDLMRQARECGVTGRIEFEDCL